MKTIFIILWCISVSTGMYAQLSDAIFAVRPENMRYLRYNYYDNVFDSAMVSLTFGEIRINSSSGTTKIFLTFHKESDVYSGDTLSGRDNILAAKGTSKNFVMPNGNSTVNFYRALMVSAIPCDPSNAGSAWGSGASGMDKHWKIGVGKIMERTEFLLELVRKADGSVLATINSVGVLTNPSSAIATRYGTLPDVMNHQRSLPSGYSGDTMFFRLVPVRFVQSYPIRMRQYSSHNNASCIREYDTASFIKLNTQQLDSLNEMYWQEIQYYYDSVKAATGHLPERLVDMAPLGKDSLYLARYFNIDSTVNGRTYISEKDGTPLSKAAFQAEALTGGESKGNIVLNVIPHPVSGKEYKVSLTSPRLISDASLTVYSAHGEETFALWKLKINKGKNTFTLYRITEAAGAHFVILKDANNRVLAKTSFIIE